MSKLLIGGFAESTTPRDLKRLFEGFGNVAEVSIHMGRTLGHIYALLEMPYADADVAQRQMDHRRWRGQFLSVSWATRSPGRFWLSPEWTPPKRPK